jgi:hypothetical protein
VSDLLSAWWVHETTVETRSGSGAYGDTYTGAVTITGLVDDSNKLIVGPDGQQVVSSARVFYPAGTVIPLGSRITLPAPFLGRAAEVIAVSVHDAGTQPVPAHVEVALR